ncbi:ATP-grasp domain-containing protein [Paenarthrobacter ilicis]|uniref:ATP-grasp domain-containing protein n=1 Tax=Paenarthrobacter ilicis TaxID=43665 RepID=UPI00300B890F
MVRVLVTGVGGPAGSSLSAQLRTLGHWVLGVDMRPVPTSAGDSVAVVSPSESPQYLWELRGLVATHGIQLLIPTVSDELVAVAAAREGFAPGVDVLISESGPVRLANDKYLTMNTLAAAGVAVPPFALPGDFASLHEAMALMGGTLVVKPRVSRGGRGVQILERSADGSRAAADIWSALDDSWIVQRFASGTEYAPVVHSAVPTSPDDLVVVLEKTELKGGRIGNAVSVERVETASAADVANQALAAVAALGLSGPVDVDIRRLSDGRPVVLEVNARFGANSAHAPELLASVLYPYVHSPARAGTV